eukprot:6676232-Ditylum_brightwellii.AAC.1
MLIPPWRRRKPYKCIQRGRGSAVRSPPCTLSTTLGLGCSQCVESGADGFKARWRRQCAKFMSTFSL